MFFNIQVYFSEIYLWMVDENNQACVQFAADNSQ